MSDFRLKVNHLIIVPLVHPDGKHIILNNGNTVPVLAKVLHIHFNFLVVVNFFGYVHNVSPTESVLTSNTSAPVLPPNIYPLSRVC